MSQPRLDHAAASPGRSTVKTEPLSGALATVTSPPIVRDGGCLVPHVNDLSRSPISALVVGKTTWLVSGVFSASSVSREFHVADLGERGSYELFQAGEARRHHNRRHPSLRQRAISSENFPARTVHRRRLRPKPESDRQSAAPPRPWQTHTGAKRSAIPCSTVTRASPST